EAGSARDSSLESEHRHRSGHHRGVLGRTPALLVEEARSAVSKPRSAAVEPSGCARHRVQRAVACVPGRMRQARWYRGIRRPRVTYPCERRTDRMSYPRNQEPGERDAAGVPASPRFPEIEQRILGYWKSDGTFEASVEAREGQPEWVFYDGPPFANGLPHYGHLLTGYAKDVFPRYQTMRGKQVHRRFGWDTHGRPAELEAMRQLGITTKDEIEQMGIGAFNAKARESVLHYTQEWQDYVTRQARWVDFENDYKTLDVTFMESVIWAFSELYKKGLAYEGFRVLPYCWNDETPLSNHELR